MAIKKEAPITINVGLDENKIPEKIKWSAPDGGIKSQDAKAMFLTFWDGNKKESLRIDLWVKEMPLDEMKLFFHQTLVSMTQSFEKATQDEKMTATLNDFCNYFEEKMELKNKKN
ncbi:MAG: gliding motility protein GldC [Flavobacteriaceae bacterium]|nr:gliding motility protein GldC [Flavobacteriaceae bacterium]|tara:strand:+ start:20070 stop:20414 length:345 start_codon:yes stop_codon:yes gene_type:complete